VVIDGDREDFLGVRLPHDVRVEHLYHSLGRGKRREPRVEVAEVPAAVARDVSSAAL
tara:strand:- start:110 stop:280 length:171 start_codon:yes stop_codon:yes gene_type:complete